jgi:hypothetical protein
MKDQIRVTVIATGFGNCERPVTKDHTAVEVLGNKPKLDEKKTETTIPTPSKTTVSNYFSASIEPAPSEAKQEKTQKQEALVSAASRPMMDVPGLTNREKPVQKDKFVAEKGRIITHYEDDMEVPTFLRKQMQ